MSEASRARMTAQNSQRSKERWIETASLLTLQEDSDLARYIKKVLRPRKMEALTQLAGGIGHDLNNHLHLAISSLETMQRHAHSGQNDGLKNRIERVLRSIHGAGALGKRLVTFARPRACCSCGSF
jgi:C4-dicarboxylate-specific signal transduction histidine kinase